ncbi:hypothetical protein [Rubellicoccus peritrichatus]|uniref:Uncharacterized protein n=1 Tax=Rubellicoccus peritrichatus TaxID=3080537 RepID=A0AAQ3L7Z4_9BACT|nr:hypothetical protein [Puniceicoccus sp. CR14]WOO40347.1 hypothetical protein RZN69_17145 [Puniceicoccus sp. CR14]
MKEDLNQISELVIRRVILEGDETDQVTIKEEEGNQVIFYERVDGYRPERNLEKTLNPDGSSCRKLQTLVNFSLENRSLNFQAKDVLDGIIYEVRIESCGTTSTADLFCPRYSSDPQIKKAGELLDALFEQIENEVSNGTKGATRRLWQRLWRATS